MSRTALSALHTKGVPLQEQAESEGDQLILIYHRDDPDGTRAGITPADARIVGEVRHVVHGWLTHRGLPSLVDSACLLTSEIVTNALIHGSGRTLRFAAEHQLSFVAIRVADGSAGRPRVLHPATDEECGRGMLLVEALAEEWGVSQDGTETWCTLSSAADVA